MSTFNTFKQQCSNKSQELYGGPLRGVYDWSLKLFTCASVNDAVAALGASNSAKQMVLIGTYNTSLTDTTCDFTNRFLPITENGSGGLDSLFSPTQAYIIVPVIQLDTQLNDDIWLFGGDRNSFNTMDSTVGQTPANYVSGFSNGMAASWYGINSIIGGANDAQSLWAAIFIMKDGVWYLDTSTSIDLSIFPNRLHATASFETTWANNQISVGDVGVWNANESVGVNALSWVTDDNAVYALEPTILLQDANNPVTSGGALLDYQPFVSTSMLNCAGKTIIRGVRYRRHYYPSHNSDIYISQNIEAWDYSIERQVTSDITVQDIREGATIFSKEGLVTLRLPVPLLKSAAGLAPITVDENNQVTGEVLAYHAAIDIIKIDKRLMTEQSVYSQYINCPILKHSIGDSAFIPDPVSPITISELSDGSIPIGTWCYYYYSIVGFDGRETLSTAGVVDDNYEVTTDGCKLSLTFPRAEGAAGYNLYRILCGWRADPYYEGYEKFVEPYETLPYSIAQPETGDPVIIDNGNALPWIISGIPTINTTALAGEHTIFYRVPLYDGSDTGAFIDDGITAGIQGAFSYNTIYASLSTKTDFSEDPAPGSWIDSNGAAHLLHNTQLDFGDGYFGDYKLRLRGKAKIIDTASTTDFVPIIKSSTGVYAAHSLYRNISKLITAVSEKLDNVEAFTYLGYGTEDQPISGLAGFIGLTYDGTYKGTTIETADIDTIAEYNFKLRPLSSYSLRMSVSHTTGPNPIISWQWNDAAAAPDIAYFMITVAKDGLGIDIGDLGDTLYTREQSFVLPTEGTAICDYTVTVTAVPIDTAIPVASDSLSFRHDPNVSLQAPLIITGATLTATRPLEVYKPVELKLYNSLEDISDKPWEDKPSYIATDKTEWVTQAIPALDEFAGELQFYLSDGRLFCNTDIRALAAYAKLSYYKLYDRVTVEVKLQQNNNIAPRLYAYHLACLPDNSNSVMISTDSVPAPAAPVRPVTIRPSRDIRTTNSTA